MTLAIGHCQGKKAIARRLIDEVLNCGRPDALYAPHLAGTARRWIAPSATYGFGNRIVRNPVISAAEDEHLKEYVEDQPIWNREARAARWMVDSIVGEQGRELVPDGLYDG